MPWNKSILLYYHGKYFKPDSERPLLKLIYFLLKSSIIAFKNSKEDISAFKNGIVFITSCLGGIGFCPKIYSNIYNQILSEDFQCINVVFWLNWYDFWDVKLDWFMVGCHYTKNLCCSKDGDSLLKALRITWKTYTKFPSDS